MDVAVCLFVFNRPEPTARVFARIAEARPARLFLIGDGPRADVPDDEPRCARVWQILEQVDWACEVTVLRATENLGLRVRLVTGLDWLFAQTDEAIILEDDCVPHPSFFPYCIELLEKFRDDERIMCISGDNCQPGVRRGDGSYYFSRLPRIWGWATWARAWNLYDPELKAWPRLGRPWVRDVLGREDAAEYWCGIFDNESVLTGTWDYQWTFSIWAQHGLAVVPNANLVSNVGWGPDATHTMDENSPHRDRDVSEMAFPLMHPAVVTPDRDADDYALDHVFDLYRPPLLKRLGRRVAQLSVR